MKNYFRRLLAALLGRDVEYEDVRAFHKKFGHLDGGREPQPLTKRKLDERVRFLQEELNELGTATTLEDQADALVDLVYVAKGTAAMMGLPWEKLWDDVRRANLAKVPGISHRGNLVDAVKPPGWVKPQGWQILEDEGWAHVELHSLPMDEKWFRDDLVHWDSIPHGEAPPLAWYYPEPEEAK